MLVFKIILLLLVVVVVQFQQAYLKNQVRYKDETLHKITGVQERINQSVGRRSM